MQIHLSSATSCAFVLNVLREHSLTFDALSSDFRFSFTHLQTKAVVNAVLADLSPYPSNYQAFSLDLVTVPLEEGDHIYRVFNPTGATEPLMTGYATVHGTDSASTAYTQGDSTVIIAYE